MTGSHAGWYKDAVVYELKIRSFYDSDGDGLGDLRGLTQKLDYLHDLGVTAVWLLPFYPSPLRDDGYDTSDYMTVHPDTGTLRDFRTFLREAHKRGLKVITELVLNHTSDQHPWFQKARKAAPGSRERNFYVWSDDPARYRDARIIFQDFESSNWAWDPVAESYYWHRFYSHQPDLNFDNPEVQRAMLQVVDHWFELGVDGLRLDAVPYLYEREGTNCENLEETHAFLKKLRAHIDRKFDNRMLLAEANQWPEDAVTYFGEGNECHMAFHFPIMPRLFMALHMEDAFPLHDILDQTPDIPEQCQWAIFLRNHDELTLEMVTDEERDYMVRAYAREAKARINLGIRRRLAPLLDNNRRRIELMNALLFSLPGTPVLYYGDEIGMGDNVYLGDRDGVRTPMQWSPDRNAGFSRANPQQLILPPISDPEYHYEAVNVETQQGNPSSLLWWTKRTIALRKQFQAFGRGSLEPLHPSNRKVLAFLRRHGEETLLVVANLSRFSQYVELDLHEFRGRSPLELFGHVEFPPIADRPYLLTLGPHNFYWFSLSGDRGAAKESSAGEPKQLPVLAVGSNWEDALGAKHRKELEGALRDYVKSRRWFRGKARRQKALRIVDVLPLGPRAQGVKLVRIEVAYAAGDPEEYVIPLSFSPGHELPESAVMGLRLRGNRGEQNGFVIEAARDPRVGLALLDTAMRQRKLEGQNSQLFGHTGPELRALRATKAELPTARPLAVEQSNTSYVFGDSLVGKLLRRVEEGASLELEVLRHLAAQGFEHVPPLQGYLQLCNSRRTTDSTVAVFQSFVPNRGDAWAFTVRQVQTYFEEVLTHAEESANVPTVGTNLAAGMRKPSSAAALRWIGAYLEDAALLGQRTGELHLALAAPGEDSSFTPESYGSLARRSFYQSLRNLTSRTFDDLKAMHGGLPEAAKENAKSVLKAERAVRARLKHILDRGIGGMRIRCHGDYHLGQVLFTGSDYHIIDFEGEPARSMAERRRKRSPLADVAGILRSYDYAVQGVLRGELPGTSVRPDDIPILEPWGQFWYMNVASEFLKGYVQALGTTELVPSDDHEFELLLDVHLLEKALYEVGYELNNRPQWAGIPLRGILDVLASQESA